MSRRKLKWGQTPWDSLSRQELLREVQRMWSALESAYNVMRMSCMQDSKYANDDFNIPTPYWDKQGTGGEAVEKARQVIDGVHARYDPEDIYRCFFRYADDLLFERRGYEIGFGWSVCDKCEKMYGANMDGKRHDGKRCSNVMGKCDGILRPLTWDDLKPQPNASPLGYSAVASIQPEEETGQ